MRPGSLNLTSRTTGPLSPAGTPRAASGARPFSTSSVARHYHRDFVFGGSHSAVRVTALKLQASTDYRLSGTIISPSGFTEPLPALAREGWQAYLQAHELHLGASAKTPPGEALTSEEFGFIEDRSALLQPSCTYADFLDRIVHTSRERGGELAFTLDRFDFFQHFAARAQVEMAHGHGESSFAHYTDTCTFGQRAPVTQGGDGLPHASITSMELGMFLEPQGRFRETPLTLLAPDDTRLDGERVRELYDAAADACSSAENRQHLETHGTCSPTAKAAVVALQAMVHGQEALLNPQSAQEAAQPARALAADMFGLDR